MTVKFDELGLGYFLGEYMGEYIVSKHLPTLSCDGIKTRRVIQVTIGEADRLKNLEDIWHSYYSKNKDSKEAKESWNYFRDFSEELSQKYLPHTLRCILPKISFKDSDVESIKNGIKDSLWQSDCCSYEIRDIDEIELYNEELCTIVELKLRINK
jgi:hypothetical protein